MRYIIRYITKMSMYLDLKNMTNRYQHCNMVDCTQTNIDNMQTIHNCSKVDMDDKMLQHLQ